MILGIGIDLVYIPRIEKILDRRPEHFLNRIFTEGERAYCLKRSRPPESFALRFAAKEACSKALGTGIKGGVAWKTMEVVSEPSGRPALVLTGRALEIACSMGCTSWNVALSHERNYAMAMVVLAG